MKIGSVLTSTDLNPLYCDFIPIFIKAWNTLFPEIDVVIVLIADSIPDNLINYSSNIRIYKPIENIHTAFQAQCIRLLYPQLIERNEGVLITDMDMLPMNRFYYEDAIKNISDNTFVCYRDVCLPHELPMCYNIALPSVWRTMFQGETLQAWYYNRNYDGIHGGSGWNTDQLILIKKFNDYKGNKSILNDRITRYNRLDRINNWQFENKHSLRTKIYNGEYSDYHCLRPYTDNKQINDFIVESLYVKNAFITGLKFQELADVYLGEDYKFYDNPNLLKNRSKWKSISSINSNYSNPTIVFCYTEFIDILIEKIQFFQNSFVLITHNSDHSVNKEHLRIFESDKIIHWFAQNLNVYHEKITPIPIGFANTMWGIEPFINWNTITPRKNTDKDGIYFYFNCETNLTERTKCKNILESKGLIFGNHVSHKEYIEQLSNKYKYAISPCGNGIDTHRLWECLSSNTIPICIRSPSTEQFAKHYPIVLIDSWESLDISNLQEPTIQFTDEVNKKLTFKYFEELIFKTIKPTILIVVISDDSNPLYSKMRDLWRLYMNSNPNIDCYFIQYREKQTELINDTLFLQGTESMKSILNKTLDSMDFFMNRSTYKYIIRTNLSSVWNFNVLLNTLSGFPSENVYSGILGNHDGILFASGSGFIMSKDVAELLLANRTIAENVKMLDDVDIGYTLGKSGISINPIGYRLDINSGEDIRYTDNIYHYRFKTTNRDNDILNMDTVISNIYLRN
jgi:hypothetical protein